MQIRGCSHCQTSESGETEIETIAVDESRNTVDSNAPNGRSVLFSHEYRGVPVDASEVDVPRSLDVKPAFGDTCGREAVRGLVSQAHQPARSAKEN